MLGLGGFLAGFTFEKSGQVDEALRWYDEALRVHGLPLARATRSARCFRVGQYRSPRLKELESGAAPCRRPLDASDEGEIVFVVGYGRVPHKIAQRVPIGLALTMFSGALAPNDVAAANRIAAQGLVTWINFPTLGREQGEYSIPACDARRRATSSSKRRSTSRTRSAPSGRRSRARSSSAPSRA